MSNFSVGFRAKSGVQVLELNGELDAHTASELEAAIQKCQDEQNTQIVINGENLAYISYAVFCLKKKNIEEVREKGGDIKIAALRPKVYNVFDLLGFPMLFDILQTEEEAIERFRNGDRDEG